MTMVTLRIKTEQIAYDINEPPAGLWQIIIRDRSNPNDETNISAAYFGINPWMSTSLPDGIYHATGQRNDSENGAIGMIVAEDFDISEDGPEMLVIEIAEVY
jgi:hypothetical protein